jgi:hypothetical protein
MNGLRRRDVRGTLKICASQEDFHESTHRPPLHCPSTTSFSSMGHVSLNHFAISRFASPLLAFLPARLGRVGLLARPVLLVRPAWPVRSLAPLDSTHMAQHLLHQPPPILLLPLSIKHADPPAPLEAVARHLELVHRVQVLHVALRRGTVGRAREPEVEVLVSSRLEVEGVVA